MGLVTRASLTEIATFGRASAAWDTNAAGALQQFPADAIRGTPGAGYLIEGGVTNTVRDPRLELLRVAGTAPALSAGAAVHPHWSTFSPNGITSEIVGRGVLNGLSYVDVRMTGTSTNSYYVTAVDNSAQSAVVGDTFTASAYVAHVGGSMANITNVSIQARLNGSATSTVMELTNSLQRFSRTNTETVAGAACYPAFGLSFPTGAEIDITLRIAGCQFAKQPFLTSLILPPAGNPAPSVRTADNLAISGAPFAAIFGAGAPQGCLVMDIQLDTIAATPNGRYFAQLDDGTAMNRVQFRTDTSGVSLATQRTVAGAGNRGIATINAVTAGAPLRAGIRWIAATGATSLCINGGALGSVVDDFPAGLNTLRLGSSHAVGDQINGRIRLARACAFAPSDAEFRAMCVMGA